MDVSAIGSGLLFGLICALFFAAGAFLFLQTVDKSLTFIQAAGIYAPLVLCWLGIVTTFNGPLQPVSWGLGVCAIIWCILVPLKVITDNNQILRDLREGRIRECEEWLAAHPQDIPIRFKLAEAFEDNGRLHDAYEQYAICLTVNPKESRARLRARQLYEQITRGAVPDGSVLVAGGGLSPLADDPGPLTATAPGIEEPRPIAQLRSAVEDEPSNAGLYAALGDELLKHGRSADALEAYRRAVWLDSSNDQFRSNLYALMDSSAHPAPGYPTLEEEKNKTEQVPALHDFSPPVLHDFGAPVLHDLSAPVTHDAEPAAPAELSPPSAPSP